MLDFLRHMVTKYTLSLYLLSGGFFVLPFVFPSIAAYKVWAEMLNILGTGVFITTFVSSILNFYVQEEIKRHFSIISGAEKSGIARIYPNRNAAMEEINSEIQKVRGTIDILSIAGTSFFVPDSEVLIELDRMCANNSNIEVRILLLDPRSKHAVDRTLLEESIDISRVKVHEVDFPNTKLCEDILLSLRQLEGILEDREANRRTSFKLSIRTYDTAPMILFVQVNGRSFVEQFHYGITEEDRKTKLTKCLGKKVPVIEYQNDSLSAQLWISHFNYLWETSVNREVLPGSANFLIDALTTRRAWLEVYSGCKALAEKYIEGFQSLST